MTSKPTVWTVTLPGEPQLRILLKFIAQKYKCDISPREYAGAANVVQGTYKNVGIVQQQFHAIRMAMYLERARVVASYPQLSARWVETVWTRAFVSRAIELMHPDIQREYLGHHESIEALGIAFANELLRKGAI